MGKIRKNIIFYHFAFKQKIPFELIRFFLKVIALVSE